MSENKTGKYFKYAIGEIILVVIGILIALSINNWNEANKLQKEEVKLIQSLKKELIRNLNIFGERVRFNDSILIRSNAFLEKAIDDDIEYKSSEIIHLFAYGPIDTNSPVLDNILQSNSRELITSDTLVEQLRKLKFAYNGVEKTEYYLDEFWNITVTEYLTKNHVGLFLGREDEFSKLDTDFVITREFLSILNISNRYQNGWIIRLKRGLNRTKETLALIEETE